jgi:hypothetical protein
VTEMSSISASCPIHGVSCPTSFRRDPQPQQKRNQRHGADSAEPQGDEPQETLGQRARIWFDLDQW